MMNPSLVSVGSNERASFLRKTYLLLTTAVGTSALAVLLATMLGSSTPTVIGPSHIAIPPVIAFFVVHPIIGLLLLLGSTFGASMVSRTRGLNVLALYGLAFVVGLVFAPAIFFAQLRASAGGTISSAPVLHAFLLATGAFGSLSGYAIVSGKDFSSLGGMLSMGLFVVIGASLLNLFVGGSVLSLAIASVTVLLFGGYVLYDTSRMLRDGQMNPVEAALSQFLNFLNLFMALLRIFSGGRRD